MRRLLTALFVLGVCAAAFVLAGASEESSKRTYKIVFDNAFGLVEDGDFRVGGVTAGKTSKLDVKEISEGSYKAVVTAEITEPGFDDFREDASCEIKPQSLLGEYLVDCQPGSAERKLPVGGTVPVRSKKYGDQTVSTIPTDLVNNILRRPYRERLRIILSELGTGLAGRPDDLAEVLRRAHPGLRETSRVLKILGDQNTIIQNFLADADTVVAELERNKGDVVRWVRETGETAEISATRREELRQSIEKFPTFLDELRPTMQRLGELADEQTPLLADLRRGAPDLEEFVERLGPFSEASRPALRSLGDAARIGTRAFRHGTEEIRELKALAAKSIQTGPAPDQQGFARPLRQFLQSMDDRRFSVEADPRSEVNGPPPSDPSYTPGGKAGFTGLEAIWNYPFWQVLSINPFDTVGHMLRVSVQASPDCSPYINDAPEDIPQETIDSCKTWLGPYQPGFNQPDPSEGGAATAEAGRTPARSFGERRAAGQPEAGPLPGQGDASKPQISLPPQVEQLLEQLRPNQGGRVPLVDDLLEGLGNGLQNGPPNLDLNLDRGSGSGGGARPEQLLDFLLAP